MGHVKVFGTWGSGIGIRVEIALKVKGVEYEFIEEEFEKKSDELLKMNPIHKKVPVLVHNGKPIVESLVILEYIDETWKDNPLLPTHPYDRAQARFWAKFMDEKIMPAIVPVLTSKGEEAQNAIETLYQHLHVLDNYINNNEECFEGNTVGYLDIVSLFVTYWLPLLPECCSHDVAINSNKFPGIFKWAHQLSNHAVITQNLPDKDKLLAKMKAHFAPSPNVSPK